jgi:AcrR family transcriptional regulator
MDTMAEEEKRLRADAERNRRALLDAAQELFAERGLEVGVGEIAERAGVGRGTLFRNFPSKERLIAAIAVELMPDAATSGRRLLEAADPGQAVFDFVEEMAGRQQQSRALFEAVADEFLANEEIRDAQAEVLGVLDQLLERAQRAGEIRPDVGGIDVMMMMKGVCEAANAFADVNPEIVERQLGLLRAALGVAAATVPLQGSAPTIDDLSQAIGAEQAHRAEHTASTRSARSAG